MRIDAYTHFIPEKYFNKIVDSGHADIGKRVREIPCIHDLDVRRKIVDRIQGLCADPFLPDAAAGGHDQGRRQADGGIRQAGQ